MTLLPQVRQTPHRWRAVRLLRSLGLWPSSTVPKQSLLTFTRCLGILLASGINVLRSLEILGQGEEHVDLKTVIVRLSAEIENGALLSMAMSQQPQVFSPVYLSMVNVGESIGKLPQLLEQTAEFIARDRDLELRARAATTYPAFVMAVCVLLTAVLLKWVVPPLLTVLVDMCGPTVALPLPTRLLQLLVAVSSNLVLQFGALAAIVMGLIALEKFLSTPDGRRYRDRLVLTLPAFGALNRKLMIARFCRSLGTLLGAGVPLQRSLSVMTRFIDNAWFTETYAIPLATRISEGVPIAIAMQRSHYFPRLVLGLVTVGEETGRLSTTMFHVVKLYDGEVNHALDAFLQVIEPVLVLIVGVVVGFVMVGVFMPLYQVAAAMGH